MSDECYISQKMEKKHFYHLYGYKMPFGKECIKVGCRSSLAALTRSASIAGKYVGIYITGSLYSVNINGVKYVDYNGNFFDESWNEMFDSLVNSTEIIATLDKIIRNNTNYRSHKEIQAKILLAIDNRPSSEEIQQRITETLSNLDAEITIHSYGICTFPEFVYLIKKSNMTGELHTNDYLEQLVEKTRELQQLTGNNIYFSVDTGNGTILKHLKELNKTADLFVEILNPPNGVVAEKCGVEHVFTTKKQPQNMYSSLLSVTFDSDADSLLFYKTCNNNTRIYNGNNICTFLALFIQKCCRRMKLKMMLVLSKLCPGSCLNFLHSKGFKIVYSPPGVKNFIEAARNYEIAVMWEPKGHGSVLFSAESKARLEKGGMYLFKEEYPEMKKDQRIMQCLSTIFSQNCTDGLANFLVMKSLLYSHFDLNLYQESFTRSLTVKIAADIIIDQDVVISPPNIQREINYYKKHYPGKVFLRASLTLEHTVRVFTEALNEEHCDKLALHVAQLVYDNCDGHGEYPEITYNE
ncbi:hypothetical protein NUSPORA_02041 [Nucleospora cyclopteri]